jgi:osmotically-inducible protein OsmY
MVAPLVNVRVANGVAELNGYVGRAGLKEEVEKLAKATAGIAAVTNNLKAMPRSSRTL